MGFGNGSREGIVDLGPSGRDSSAYGKGMPRGEHPRSLGHSRTRLDSGLSHRGPAGDAGVWCRRPHPRPPSPSSHPLPWLLTEAMCSCHNVYKRISARRWFPLFLECFWQSLHVFLVSWEAEQTFSLFQTRSQSVN